MIERFRAGRELTASVISNPDNPRELIALPLIEIAPKEGVYDFEAKYQRNDTIYTVSPSIDPEITRSIQTQAVGICNAIGIRHLVRADFLLSSDASWTMLEVNTMPGFTATSLLPKAAGAFGLPMPMFCEHLVRCALGNSDAKKPIVQG
jgi:D-alanine-D-alanine ligase-like ATP-grasp enzyme